MTWCCDSPCTNFLQNLLNVLTKEVSVAWIITHPVSASSTPFLALRAGGEMSRPLRESCTLGRPSTEPATRETHGG